jgi:hypothetical protein
VTDELSQLQSRTPQKKLFLPPREDELFAYPKPTGREAPKEEVKTAQPPKEEVTPPQGQEPAPEIPTVNSLAGHLPPAGPKPDLALAEAGLPIEMNPEVDERLAAKEPSPEGRPITSLPEPESAEKAPPEEAPLTAELGEPAPVAPTSGEVETIIALEPAAPKPPPAQAEAAKPPEKPPEEVTAKTPEKTPVVTLKPAGKKPPSVTPRPGKGTSFFLQLAAYASEKQAQDTAAGLSEVYPVSVAGPKGAETPLYRILVGPLNRAESGTLLLWFRYRGFPDAFVKAGD